MIVGNDINRKTNCNLSKNTEEGDQLRKTGFILDKKRDTLQDLAI